MSAPQATTQSLNDQQILIDWINSFAQDASEIISSLADCANGKVVLKMLIKIDSFFSSHATLQPFLQTISSDSALWVALLTVLEEFYDQKYGCRASFSCFIDERVICRNKNDEEIAKVVKIVLGTIPVCEHKSALLFQIFALDQEHDGYLSKLIHEVLEKQSCYPIADAETAQTSSEDRLLSSGLVQVEEQDLCETETVKSIDSQDLLSLKQQFYEDLKGQYIKSQEDLILEKENLKHQLEESRNRALEAESMAQLMREELAHLKKARELAAIPSEQVLPSSPRKDALLRQLEEKEQEIVSLKKKLESMHPLVKQNRELCDQIEIQKARLEEANRNNQLLEKFKGKLEKIVEMKSCINDLKNQLQAYTERNEALESELSALHKVVDNYTQDRTQEKLFEQLQAKTNEYQTSCVIAEELAKERDELKTALQLSKTSADCLQNELDAVRRMVICIMEADDEVQVRPEDLQPLSKQSVELIYFVLTVHKKYLAKTIGTADSLDAQLETAAKIESQHEELYAELERERQAKAALEARIANYEVLVLGNNQALQLTLEELEGVKQEKQRLEQELLQREVDLSPLHSDTSSIEEDIDEVSRYLCDDQEESEFKCTQIEQEEQNDENGTDSQLQKPISPTNFTSASYEVDQSSNRINKLVEQLEHQVQTLQSDRNNLLNALQEKRKESMALHKELGSPTQHSMEIHERKGRPVEPPVQDPAVDGSEESLHKKLTLIQEELFAQIHQQQHLITVQEHQKEQMEIILDEHHNDIQLLKEQMLSLTIQQQQLADAFDQERKQRLIAENILRNSMTSSPKMNPFIDSEVVTPPRTNPHDSLIVRNDPMSPPPPPISSEKPSLVHHISNEVQSPSQSPSFYFNFSAKQHQQQFMRNMSSPTNFRLHGHQEPLLANEQPIDYRDILIKDVQRIETSFVEQFQNLRQKIQHWKHQTPNI